MCARYCNDCVTVSSAVRSHISMGAKFALYDYFDYVNFVLQYFRLLVHVWLT